MKASPTKKIAEKLGVTRRHARRLKAKKDPRIPNKAAISAKREEQNAEVAKGTLGVRKKSGGKFEAGDGLGLTATVERLRQFEQQCAKELERARETGDHDLEWSAQKKWTLAVNALRQSEKEAPGVDKENKKQVSISDVTDVWTRSLLVFRKSLEANARRVATNEAVPTELRVIIESLIQDENARTLEGLKNLDWKKVLDDD